MSNETSSDKNEKNKQQKIIPIRRVPLSDQTQLPSDYSATPGGTLFSTTPGGTRIVYDRNFLMQCRTSPLAQTPPVLPNIPGVTRLSPHQDKDQHQQQLNGVHEGPPAPERPGDDHPQFQMDI